MSNNPEHTVLGQRTSGPGLLSRCSKPFMCSVMLDVRWINQGNEDIDVEKKPTHGSSSRSCCTNSEVTRGVSALVGKRGTPLRVFRPESAGRNALRASKEITSPTLFLCVAANSLAAASTSSSI